MTVFIPILLPQGDFSFYQAAEKHPFAASRIELSDED
jgi:hypothetical protein